jgi:hypothetical protein
MNAYDKTGYLRSIPAGLTDEIVQRLDTAPPWVLGLDLGQMGGAVARVKPDATAYWNRGATYAVLISDEWTPGPQSVADQAALRDLWNGVRKFTHGYYINADSDVEDDRLRETYGLNYARLVELKNRYDPTNLFRLNANIKPSAL